MTIKRNQIRCKRCDDVIQSRHRHDFVMCSCGAVGVDGGKDYLRRIGTDYVELSIEEKEEKDVEMSTPLIMDLDEEPEPTLEVIEEKLTPHERVIRQQAGLIQTLKETVALYKERDNLLNHLQEQIGLHETRITRNVFIRNKDQLVHADCTTGTVFEGEWVAIPREDLDALRRFFEALGKEEE